MLHITSRLGRQETHCTYPILTLMRNPPPINRHSTPICLSPRPLNRQIRITHQRLANIVKAVIDMLFLVLEHAIVRLGRAVEVHAGFEREQERAHVSEAVQLVEDGNVVDLAFGSGVVCVHRLAWWEVVSGRVWDQDEAVTGWRDVVAPGLVCFWGGRTGEDGFFECYRFLGNWDVLSMGCLM